MVVTDNEPAVARALGSATPFCDELVLVTVGSTDAAREVAAEYGARVHAFKWGDDWAAARNASFDHCSGDWILWMDPDDVVPIAAQSAFALVKNDLNDATDAIFSPHRHHDPGGRPTFSLSRERLIRRAAGLRWEGPAYESIAVPRDRSVLRRELAVEYRPGSQKGAIVGERNLRILRQAVSWGDRSARTLFHLANELHANGRFQEAAHCYRDYLAIDLDGADRYWAQVMLAESLASSDDRVGAERAALQALSEDSSRAEAFVTLGRLRFDAEDWEEAMPLFKAATASRRPEFGYSRQTDYTFLPWDYLAVCYEKIGRIPDAIQAGVRGVADNPEAERIRANLHWMVDRL